MWLLAVAIADNWPTDGDVTCDEAASNGCCGWWGLQMIVCSIGNAEK